MTDVVVTDATFPDVNREEAAARAGGASFARHACRTAEEVAGALRGARVAVVQFAPLTREAIAGLVSSDEDGDNADAADQGDHEAPPPSVLITGFRAHGKSSLVNTACRALAGEEGPLLLRGVTSIAEDGYKGRLLADLVRGGCALISAHTNADIVADGVSDVIATRLGLTGTTPIVPGADPSVGGSDRSAA